MLEENVNGSASSSSAYDMNGHRMVPGSNSEQSAGGVSTNGTTASNDFTSNGVGSQPNNNHIERVQLDKTNRDIVRLIGQHLKLIGLDRTAQMLMQESGCSLEHPAATKFREHVLSGDWHKADYDLQELQSIVDDDLKLTAKHTNLIEMKFLLLEQKYLEYLDDSRPIDALHVLRNELTPLQHNTPRVHQLSSYMMCTNNEELYERAGWEGKNIRSRTRLMDRLQSFLPASVMLPPRRLHSLLRQAVELQTEHCTHHDMAWETSIDNVSLLSDHNCSNTSHAFPIHPVQVCGCWQHQRVVVLMFLFFFRCLTSIPMKCGTVNSHPMVSNWRQAPKTLSALSGTLIPSAITWNNWSRSSVMPMASPSSPGHQIPNISSLAVPKSHPNFLSSTLKSLSFTQRSLIRMTNRLHVPRLLPTVSALWLEAFVANSTCVIWKERYWTIGTVFAWTRSPFSATIKLFLVLTHTIVSATIVSSHGTTLTWFRSKILSWHSQSTQRTAWRCWMSHHKAFICGICVISAW